MRVTGSDCVPPVGRVMVPEGDPQVLGGGRGSRMGEFLPDKPLTQAVSGVTQEGLPTGCSSAGKHRRLLWQHLHVDVIIYVKQRMGL